MKVTVVTTLSVDRFNYVKVETDEGLVGIRELHPASGTGGTPALIDHLPSLKSGGIPLCYLYPINCMRHLMIFHNPD